MTVRIGNRLFGIKPIATHCSDPLHDDASPGERRSFVYPKRVGRKKVFHVIGLPHAQTNKNFVYCAFKARIINFCKAIMSLGHTVYPSELVSQLQCCSQDFLCPK